MTSTVAVPEKELQPPPIIQEFSVKISKKKCNVMQFHASQQVDFKNWRETRMQRENNMRLGPSGLSGTEEEQPRFGAGSVFGREAREEARRLRFSGRAAKNYRAEDQPWLLRAKAKGTDGKKDDGKKFRGIRGGGVGENSAYYIFTTGKDGSMEAYPVQEWYSFKPVQRYKALSAEEAEEEFNKRGKTMNFFSLMVRKRLGKDETNEEAAGSSKANKPKTAKELKISDMDEWMDSDDDDNESDDSDKEKKNSDDEDEKKKKQKKKVDLKNKQKKRKDALDDEAFEESDDGDEEGRECDYISDSSVSESELEQQKEMKSVAEEKGLKKLLDSGDEDDDDSSDDDADEKSKDDQEDTTKENEKEEKSKDSKASSQSKGVKKNRTRSSAASSKPNKIAKENQSSNSSSGNNSLSDLDSGTDQDKNAATASVSGVTRKRQGGEESSDVGQSKKSKVVVSGNACIPGASESGITIDAVSRYLMRKPMTVIDLLKKFKSKKTSLNKEEIGHILMLVLTKINPTKQKVNGVMYYSLRD